MPPHSSSPDLASKAQALPKAPAKAQAKAPVKTQPQTWVQSLLAIATGYLVLALGIIAIMGLLVLQDIEAFTPPLLLLLTLSQLCLATTGSYITALLAPSKASLQPTKSLVNHGFSLTALVLILWLISVIASPGQEPWSIHLLNLLTALCGISTGTWLRIRQIQLSPQGRPDPRPEPRPEPTP